ncbi:hypothetical protein N7495_002160 [Penicillium taxi]|uniref:uncharacterized protein n=1 Tax=Penicillium taxi TaxID=168475 RepID=UPI00254571F9|nr:uncharacterized protein N7495_002160 [Penicillium taxi]KAJ5901632.1 hypothetical protein N7495_002160 [Penicillium taxi]
MLSITSSWIGAAEGYGVASSIIGVLGGLSSEVSSDLVDADDETSSELGAIASKILTKFYAARSTLLEDVFVTGNLTKFSSDLIESDFKNDLSNFFNGRFIYSISSAQLSKIEEIMSKRYLQTLTGVALDFVNYYILKGAYITSECSDKVSGTVIDGFCYTLEYPTSGWDIGDFLEAGSFSTQISNDSLTLLTNTYKVALEDLYNNSYECQNSTNAYYSALSVDIYLGRLFYYASYLLI